MEKAGVQYGFQYCKKDFFPFLVAFLLCLRVRLLCNFVGAALQLLSGKAVSEQFFPERRASLTQLYHPRSGGLLDKAVVLRFPAPRSFTGEDVVELNCHGSPAVVRAVLGALGSVPGMRMARAGEFTRRAFEAGKMDLTQLESTADLLAAETESQRLQALSLMQGKQGELYGQWRKELLSCLASAEAVLDFGEDAELGADVALAVLPRVRALRDEIERRVKEDGHRGEIVRSGARTLLIGPPNSGKSSLLNTLSGREVAIVSSLPGTTRDLLEVPLELGGLKVILTDSAGVRTSGDPIESEGISRALAGARGADLGVFVLDGADIFSRPEYCLKMLRSFSVQSSRTDQGHRGGPRRPAIVVLNKVDLLFEDFGNQHLQEFQQRLRQGKPFVERYDSTHELDSGIGKIAVEILEIVRGLGFEPFGVAAMSCKNGQGVDNLLVSLQQAAEEVSRTSAPEGTLIVTRQRHRERLESCVSSLLRYEELHEELEIAAEELRYAARALGELTGAIDSEEILEAIFGEFCIGK
mmetsp:Transcript_40090/g.95231  ORF Transcript_40090/g.95231 Transcript_40090/m.95231 type:complete len:526 (-) Transcript_40090:697-2274(-)